MLEISEDEWVDFLTLKTVMPNYEDICEFFYKLKNNLLEEDID